METPSTTERRRILRFALDDIDERVPHRSSATAAIRGAIKRHENPFAVGARLLSKFDARGCDTREVAAYRS
jgi:hypothetical protein